MYLPVFQPQPDPSVTISIVGRALTYANFISQFYILLRLVCPLHEIVVSTPGDFKKLAHNRYWVLVAMTMDNSILCFWPHFPSMDCRKSRNSLFSIHKRSSFFCAFCRGGWPSFRGCPFGRSSFSMAIFRCSRLCRYDQSRICL